ncbi:Molecular chaperone (small heat shock protein) [Archaeoglobus sulfaticallidus PM70-1]|uniref:Molecular chaperone (Small heat shock protein) n=1 Tax=Archaeoglobus sulfaticallidus PM70-1 TaxID=387631 RepID=N0BMC9_9EURY|nr:archaeal heat shock protein Hsp20 [Archaeoglobus sulfaticallidus]AGK61425.1 Molecular chaperone (small heat shock protein) [Archaeoglobus sulfaticallidus PM70-1]
MPWKRRRKTYRDWDDIFDEMFEMFSFPFSEEFDEIFKRITRDFNEIFRSMPESKPIIRGFSIRIGPDGKPEIKEFGTKFEGGIKGIEERKPLIDVMETDEEVQIIAEMPGVNKEDIDLNATETTLEIKADGENRKYFETVELPAEVIPESAKARYNNGVLEVVMKKKHPKKEQKKKIDIE